MKILFRFICAILLSGVYVQAQLPAPVTHWSWRAAGNSQSIEIQNAVHGNGKVVMVGLKDGGSPFLASTADGLVVVQTFLQPTDHAPGTSSQDYSLNAVAYANGQWIALGRDGDPWMPGTRVWRSSDNGTTWSDFTVQ
jgi:hypothetical protein